jgi:hypothetical protein
MYTSRRSVLPAAGAGLASLEIAVATSGSALADTATITDDFTLMSPFGATPTRRSDMTGERWEVMGRFFRNGTFAQEVVQAYSSARECSP